LIDVVENRTSYVLQGSALHIFETHSQAEKVSLKFSNPVLASMLTGRKIMHLHERDPFDFVPGESLILPEDELMEIDFPDATHATPTQCLAMEIASEKIQAVVQLMNEKMGKCDGREWELMDYNFHFTNDPGIFQILQRLVYLYTEKHPSKDFFVANMIQELIIRILQTDSRHKYLLNTETQKSGKRFDYVIDYIKAHLNRELTIDELSKKACMSKSHFHRVFRNEFGMSAVAFVNKERITKAAQLLKEPNADLTEVFMTCGFQNRSYFNRMFKRFKGMSPGKYHNLVSSKAATALYPE
jgi:AraC-like DNA-binding protein